MTTYSIAAGYVILPHVLGDYVACSGHITTWDSIAQDSALFVMFGGVPVKNAQVAAGGAGEHTLALWLERAKANGVDFVNVSPLKDDAPDYLNAQWLAVRPNTDVALMLGLAHTLWEENLHDTDFLARYCVGFEKFEAYLTGETDGRPKSADWAAPITGIGAGVIRTLARRMAGARTMLNTNWSLQRGDHGEQTFWMTVTLAAMLGQIGLPGGGFGFGYGSMGGRGAPREDIPSVRMSFGKNPTGSFIPVARIADMMLQPGEEYDFNGERRTYPDIRMVYWCGGNPFHHHQDLNRLVEAWRRPETIVVHDPWWTSTARHADIVLPATTTLERNDIGSSSRDRFILAMHKVIEPVGEARHDFDIFSELAERLGFRSAFTEDRDEMEWLRHVYEEARQRAAAQGVVLDTFDHFWETGPHGSRPAGDAPRISGRFQGRPGKTRAQDAFGENRDIFGAHRELRVRRLPAPLRLARTRGVAGKRTGGEISPAHDLEPAAHEAPRPDGQRLHQRQEQDSGQGTGVDSPR